MPTPNYEQLANDFVSHYFAVNPNNLVLFHYSLKESIDFYNKKFGKDMFDSEYYKLEIAKIMIGGE